MICAFFVEPASRLWGGRIPEDRNRYSCALVYDMFWLADCPSRKAKQYTASRMMKV